MKQLCVILISFSFLLFLNSCDSVNEQLQKAMATPIEDILDNPAKFEGSKRQVQVYGEVLESLNIGFLQYYKIKDETGSIAIIPSNAESVPNQGVKVQVKGYVKQYFKLGDFQLVAIEETP